MRSGRSALVGPPPLGVLSQQAPEAEAGATASLAHAAAADDGMAPNATTTALLDVAVLSALLDAASVGDAQAVAAWLDERGGVDVRYAERENMTLLMVVAVAGQEAMVRMLLQRGASVNLQDSKAWTALMGAAFQGHTAIVQALLDAKADASLQDGGGRTALMVAELHKRTAIAQLLRQHAERPTAEAEAHAAAADDGMAPKAAMALLTRRAWAMRMPWLRGWMGAAAWTQATQSARVGRC